MDLQKLLLQDLERRAGTKSARRIAVLIDEKPGAVSKWMHGQQMRNDILARIAGKMGWNLDRARPEYDPAADLAAERERLIGEVGRVAESPASPPPQFSSSP